MRQRYTIELQRYTRQTAFVEVVAEDFSDAERLAVGQALLKHDFPWVTDPEPARVVKIAQHAGEVPDESN